MDVILPIKKYADYDECKDKVELVVYDELMGKSYLLSNTNQFLRGIISSFAFSACFHPFIGE
jgi:hypothetical protein